MALPEVPLMGGFFLTGRGENAPAPAIMGSVPSSKKEALRFMVLMIELPPELEARLRQEAARAGQKPDSLGRDALEHWLGQAQPRAGALPRSEADLLLVINQGLAPELWQRYHELIAKRRAETLTPDEQAHLIELSDQIEQANSRRMEALIELASLRQIPLEALMDQLGIKSPGYA
jgi:hypothetical protein